MIQHMQLLAKYGSRKLGDLTATDVTDIARVLGHELSPEHTTNIMGALQQDSLDSLADWASKPDNLAKLQSLIAAPASQEPLAVKCPHCAGIFELHYD